MTSFNWQTGALLPVGGTHRDPVTGLPVPIEIGGMMEDPNTRKPVPILAVAIDSTSGKTEGDFFFCEVCLQFVLFADR